MAATKLWWRIGDAIPRNMKKIGISANLLPDMFTPIGQKTSQSSKAASHALRHRAGSPPEVAADKCGSVTRTACVDNGSLNYLCEECELVPTLLLVADHAESIVSEPCVEHLESEMQWLTTHLPVPSFVPLRQGLLGCPSVSVDCTSTRQPEDPRHRPTNTELVWALNIAETNLSPDKRWHLGPHEKAMLEYRKWSQLQ